MDVIVIENLCKSFKIYGDRAVTLKEKVIHRKRRSYHRHLVLNNIDLTIKKGEVVGLIGENGCGKSTLLKLMTRIYYPEQGTLQVNGRVSSLLELGAGFHQDLSGRENIYTNASIFGLSKKEIDRRLDSIISFSELEEFIDNPVRTYSSGMYMRLAFSVAINVDADILLIDEILAVGDTNFQTKCYKKLNKLKEKGITIVIVTHDSSVVEKFCNRAIWVNEGRIMVDDLPIKTVDAYRKYMNEKQIKQLVAEEKRESEQQKCTEQVVLEEQSSAEETIPEENTCVADEEHCSADTEQPVQCEEEEVPAEHEANRFGTKAVEILEAYFINHNGEKTSILRGGEHAEIKIHYKVHHKCKGYMFGMGFYTTDDVVCYGNNTNLDGIYLTELPREGVVTYNIQKLPLLSGDYKLNVAVVDENGTPLDFIRHYSDFTVISEDRSVGLFSMEHNWVLPDTEK